MALELVNNSIKNEIDVLNISGYQLDSLCFGESYESICPRSQSHCQNVNREESENLEINHSPLTTLPVQSVTVKSSYSHSHP